jgi:DNA polymerase III delta prime subunit
MIESDPTEFLWVERYRPKVINDCILSPSLKETFKSIAAQAELPNLLLSGSAGVGKTTIAKALCNEIGAEYLFINGSDEGRSIDVLRTSIKGFASTVSLTDAKKVVIIDEAEFMNAQTIQPALRSFIEEFSNNCRFIFTCNFKNRIIEPLHSRCSVIDFKIEGSSKQKVAADLFKRVTEILKIENVEFDPKAVAKLIEIHFPDFRRVLNELQRYSVSGRIDTGVLVNLANESFKELIKSFKEKNFTEVRKWVSKNSDIDSTFLFRTLYDSANEVLEKPTIPALVLILAEYQHRAAFVADQEINIMACFTEIMKECKFL